MRLHHLSGLSEDEAEGLLGEIGSICRQQFPNATEGQIRAIAQSAIQRVAKATNVRPGQFSPAKQSILGTSQEPLIVGENMIFSQYLTVSNGTSGVAQFKIQLPSNYLYVLGMYIAPGNANSVNGPGFPTFNLLDANKTYVKEGSIYLCFHNATSSVPPDNKFRSLLIPGNQWLTFEANLKATASTDFEFVVGFFLGNHNPYENR